MQTSSIKGAGCTTSQPQSVSHHTWRKLQRRDATVTTAANAKWKKTDRGGNSTTRTRKVLHLACILHYLHFMSESKQKQGGGMGWDGEQKGWMFQREKSAIKIQIEWET